MSYPNDPRCVPCPQCHAPTDQPCLGRRGERIAHHATRLVAALELEAKQAQREPRPYDRPVTTPPPITEDEKARGRAIIARIKTEMRERGHGT